MLQKICTRNLVRKYCRGVTAERKAQVTHVWNANVGLNRTVHVWRPLSGRCLKSRMHLLTRRRSPLWANAPSSQVLVLVALAAPQTCGSESYGTETALSVLREEPQIGEIHGTAASLLPLFGVTGSTSRCWKKSSRGRVEPAGGCRAGAVSAP